MFIHRTLLLLALLAFCTQDAHARPPSEGVFNSGNIFFDQGKLDDAVIAYQEAVELSPAEPAYRNALGSTLATQGKLDLARDQFEHALNLDADFTKALKNRGAIHLLKKDYLLAIEDFSSAIKKGMRDYKLLLLRAQAFIGLDSRNLKLAIADIDSAIAIAPNSSEAWTASSQARLQCQELARAESDARRAIDLDGQNYHAHYSLCLSLGKLGRNEEALKAINRAIELEANTPRLFAERAATLNRMQDFHGAVASCTTALSIDHRCQQAYFERAQARRKLKELHQATEDYTVAIELNGQDAVALAQRGLCHANTHKHREAIKDYTRALNLNADIPELYAARAESLFFLGETEKALADCEASIRVAPGSAAAYGIRGAILAERWHLDASLNDLNRAIAIGASSAHYVLYYRAFARLALDMPEAAIEDIRHCISKQSEQPNYHYALAVVLATHPRSELRNGKEALVHANKAVELGSKHQDVHLFLEALAAAHAETGNFDQAIRVQDLAVRSSPPNWRPKAMERRRNYQYRRPYREQISTSGLNGTLLANWPRL